VRHVEVENRERVAIIRLNNGAKNPLSTDLVDELSSALAQVSSESQGIVLAGGAKFFSIGFDLPSLLKLDRAGMSQFFYQFNQIAFDLFTSPLPTACAIAGHAIAGGNILALTCDYRFAASVERLIGLNEVRLGVPVPYLADLMLRQIIGDRAATEILYQGKFVSLSEAKKIGLIDEIVPQGELENHAVEKVAELAVLPRAAFSAIKSNRIDDIQVRYKQNYVSKHETFLDCWFSQQTQSLLKEAAQKF
jgi:enoyl-CoA hydratase/carnithine racemase